jgi:hydrogenase maturation factor
MAVNLSDIAAMGGTPKEALVSIAIPDTVRVETLDAIYEGMKSMALQYDVNLLGGDTTGSRLHLVINVALVGEAREEEVLYRSGAKPEDVVFLRRQGSTFCLRTDPSTEGRRCWTPTSIRIPTSEQAASSQSLGSPIR